jgi:aldehyde:ferredoxin oxidoreductase
VVYGFHGQLLHIDLNTGASVRLPVGEARLRNFVGGIGLGTSLLHEFAPAGVDPFSPANPLIFASAPLVGTGLTTTAKYAVITKSPLTGFIADSLSSSHFALQLKRAGIDALVITGRAASPVYVAVSESEVEIRDAGKMLGQSPTATEASIRRELDSPAVAVASIGVAGENRVRFATISNEGRHAGRGGTGAVMGAKNLKAIAVSGDRVTPVADPPSVERLSLALRRRGLGDVTDKYRNIGTVANLAVFNRLGTLPTHNFQQSTFEHAHALSGETLTVNHFARRHGCASCTIQCERLFKSESGNEQRLEYETLFALGPLCGIDDPACVLEAAGLCDRYGMDTISTGGTIAWAMECAEKGLLPPPLSRRLKFGDAEGLLATITAVAERNDAGELLADGSRLAAASLGGEALNLAIHVKGLELPGYEPRSLKTMALGLAVSPRGACHNRSGAYEADFSGAVDRLRGDAARGALVAASEDFAAVLDSLIVCKFLRKCFDDFYGEAAGLLRSVTGWDYSADELRRAGERINMSKRLFNERQGWRPEDDWLPGRLLSESLPTGVARGNGLSPAELREMILGYYRARGLHDSGYLREESLGKLGLASPRTDGADPGPDSFGE